MPKAIEEIQKLLGGHSMEREFLIENLHIIQDRHNQLPASLLAALAQKMSLSQAEVYEVASFYHHFKVIKEEDQPLPNLTVRICDGIACEMSGATNLFRELSIFPSSFSFINSMPLLIALIGLIRSWQILEHINSATRN